MADAAERATAASQLFNSSDAAEVTAHHLLYESTLPPAERVARLRRVAVTEGLDANTRPLAWTLLLGCGRIEARRYSSLCDGLSDDAQKIRDAQKKMASPAKALASAEQKPAGGKGKLAKAIGEVQKSGKVQYLLL